MQWVPPVTHPILGDRTSCCLSEHVHFDLTHGSEIANLLYFHIHFSSVGLGRHGFCLTGLETSPSLKGFRGKRAVG